MEIAQQWSWLKPIEVFNLLKSFETAPYTFITSFPSPPKSGSIFFIRKSEFKRWKQDGHTYISRKNGSGTREDREKYSFGSEVVQCTYVHGSGSCPSCKNSCLVACNDCNITITSILFHRRAYWLLSNPGIILVHYLDESENPNEHNYSGSGEQIRKISDLLREIDFDSTSDMQIIEYCPEWSDVHGGVKVLLCTEPPLIVSNPQNLYCAFGDILVYAESVILGVFKCYTPAHIPGFVDFFLVYENKEITCNRKIFEFREIGKGNKGKEVVEWWESDKKVIKRELDKDLCEELDEEYQNDSFDEGFFLTQFMKVLNKGGWERVLRSGRGFLHYFCALGYTGIIKKISGFIKNPNLKDETLKSPIDIALIKQNYDCAYELIRIGCENKADIRFQRRESLDDRVQKIQSHVRAWLKQKQFRNLKSAAKVLQKTFRGMIVRRNFKYQKQAAIVIQKSVRRWLVSADHH